MLAGLARRLGPDVGWALSACTTSFLAIKPTSFLRNSGYATVSAIRASAQQPTVADSAAAPQQSPPSPRDAPSRASSIAEGNRHSSTLALVSIAPPAPSLGAWAQLQQWQLGCLKAVLVDAAGTLLVPSESTALVYLRYARRHGCSLTERQVLERFRRAYNTPWGASSLRYVGDARPFWRHIVTQSTGCSSEQLSEELYSYYAQPEAWLLADGAAPALERLRAAGVKLAVVSNFDTRLRPILAALGVDHLFDCVVVSAEVGAEKPNPVIFEAALEALGVQAHEAVHVGDDRRNDVWGARDAGVAAWLWGSDVGSFRQVAERVLRRRSWEDGEDEDEFEGGDEGVAGRGVRRVWQ